MDKKIKDNRYDWNQAMTYNEDTAAVMSSEVFRNYAQAMQKEAKLDDFVLPLHVPSATNIDQRYLDAALNEALSFPSGSKERALFMNYYKKLQSRLELQEEIDSPVKTAGDKALEAKNKTKFRKDTDDIMKKVEKAEDASKVPTPIIENLPYDGDDYQEHVERVHDANKDGRSTYDEFYPDYKVYHKAADESEIIKMALEEIINTAPAEVTMEQEMGFETPKTKTAPKTHTFDISYEKLYNTGAGANSSVNIGVTKETERLMDAGIDYVDSGKVKETKAPAAPQVMTQPEEAPAAEPVDEVKAAEVALGLDKNIFYILRKMGK